MPFWGGGKSGSRTRIFFASDIHGSETCFRKWVNAAAVYEAQALILGGDLTGKALVPLVEDGDGWRGELHGRPVLARDQNELSELRRKIRVMGHYDLIVTPQESEELKDPARRKQVFDGAIRSSVAGWVGLVEERLAGKGISVYMMLGNDDEPELAEVLRGSSVMTYAEDGVAELPGGYEMVSVGFSTPTPWHTPREVSEAELGAKVAAQVARLADSGQAVFNLHCPPAGTHLDQAPKLDANLRPIVDTNGPQVASVGSQAVRAAIEEAQPLLGLHGHVHESPGTERLGRTLCLNPGSDYGQGVLRGALVELDRQKGVRTWQLVQA